MKSYKLNEDSGVPSLTAGQIRAAAAGCADAARVLRDLFPSAFEEVQSLPVARVGQLVKYGMTTWLYLDKEKVRKTLEVADTNEHGFGVDLNTLEPGTVTAPGSSIFGGELLPHIMVKARHT